MTIREAEKFYSKDKKKYNVLDNKEFLAWFNSLIKKGYHSYVDLDDMQSLIDRVVNWYEIKYPERELESNNGVIHMNFEDIDRISQYMDIRQFMYRLPHKELCLIESDYRSTGGGLKTIYDENGNVTGFKSVLFMSLKNKEFDPSNYDSLWELFITADTKTGKIEPTYHFKDLVSEDEIGLKELLGILKEKLKEIDTTKLEECLYDHSCDMNLRNRLLQLAALKMVYSPNTIPERGYERAKRFISEFNKKLDLELSTEEIDEIMLTASPKDKEEDNVIVGYGKEKPKRFIKTMFRKNKSY